MKVISSYKVKILHFNHIFDETVSAYQKAVAFFLHICEQEWADIEPLKLKKRNNYMEHLTIRTKRNPEPKYDFNQCCYKMPSYLRRAAIQEALGDYSSFVSNHKNWVENGQKGKEPTLTYHRNTMPVLYKPHMFLRTDRLTARIKVFHQNDWVWLEVALWEQDIRYIEKHCKLDNMQSPKLKRQGKCWYLAFPFERNVTFTDVPIDKRLICAVDLGLNKNAVCSIMQSDGTVVARKFIDFPTEKDHLYKALGRQKKAQQKGNHKTPVLWKHANDINREISRKTARAIMEFAVLYNVDVIVFEHLDSNGKKRGRKKQRLALWRKQEIQRIVFANNPGYFCEKVQCCSRPLHYYDESSAKEEVTKMLHDYCDFTLSQRSEYIDEIFAYFSETEGFSGSGSLALSEALDDKDLYCCEQIKN